MSKFRIQEGGNTTNPKTRYYQVVIGGKSVGEPYKTREEAQGYIKLLEDREAEAARERDDQLDR